MCSLCDCMYIFILRYTSLDSRCTKASCLYVCWEDAVLTCDLSQRTSLNTLPAALNPFPNSSHDIDFLLLAQFTLLPANKKRCSVTWDLFPLKIDIQKTLCYACDKTISSLNQKSHTLDLKRSKFNLFTTF